MNGAAPGPFQNGDQDLWEHPGLSRHGATLIRTPMFFNLSDTFFFDCGPQINSGQLDTPRTPKILQPIAGFFWRKFLCTTWHNHS